jgi:hypothetical protein
LIYRFKKKESDYASHGAYNWDPERSFDQTDLKVYIGSCQMVRTDGSRIPLKRRGETSWCYIFGEEDLLTVKLDGDTIAIDLNEREPQGLGGRIAVIHAEIAGAKGSKLEAARLLKDDREIKAILRESDVKIRELETERERLVHLQELSSSHIDVRIFCETADRKFEIARLLAAAFER